MSLPTFCANARSRLLLAGLLATSALLVPAASSCGSPSSAGVPDDGGIDASAADADASGVTPDGAAELDAPSDATSLDAGPCSNLPSITLVSHGAADLDVAQDPGLAADAGTPLGIYDPSLFYPPGSPGGVLSYSITSTGDVHTRIAVTADHGASFTFAAEPNHTTPITVTTSDTTVCGSGNCQGVLWHEVSTIAADPGDPDANRLFKLFVHSYVYLPASQAARREWGYIGLYAAPDPKGPWTAEEPLLGWRSSATLSTAVTQALTDTPALADCVVFTEPSALVTPLGLDLALTCLSYSGTLRYRVILLRSTDHAKSFSYVGPLLVPDDARCLASTIEAVNGADLFAVGQTEYLMVTPLAPIPPNPISPNGLDYAGCLVIPVADPASGAIARTDGGAPNVVRWLAADDGRFTGPCAFAEGATTAGYLVPMVSSLPAPIFHVHATNIAGP